MSGVVIFNAANFIVQYPAFAAYNTAHPTGLQNYFNMATLYLNNSLSSYVSDVAMREQLLYLLVAHLGFMDGILTTEGQGSKAGMVGRVSQATEGSVTVQTQMSATPGTAAWYLQTQYGAQFWAATARYRTMRYVRPRCA